MHAPNASSTTAPTSTSAPVAIRWTSTRGRRGTGAAGRPQHLGAARPPRRWGSRARAGRRRASPCAAAPARAPSPRPGTRSRARPLRRRRRASRRPAPRAAAPRTARGAPRARASSSGPDRPRTSRSAFPRFGCGGRSRDAPRAHTLELDQRADRPRRRAVSLEERQAGASDEPLARRRRTRAGPSRPTRTRPRSPCGAGARSRRIGSAHTSSPSSRGGNASNATRPDRGSCGERLERRAEHVGLHRCLPRDVQRVVLRRVVGQRLPELPLRRSSRTPGSDSPCDAGRLGEQGARARRTAAPPRRPSVRIFVPNDKSTAASNIVTGSSTRIAPRPRSHASRSAVFPASAPVCATIDRRAASLRPSGAHTRTGLRAARSASSPRPMPSTSRIVSMYVHTTFVCGSAAAHANMSPESEHRLVPDPEDEPQAGAAVRCELVQRPRDGPRLRDHADRAGDRLGRRRRPVRRHALDVVHEPLDVRAEHGQRDDAARSARSSACSARPSSPASANPDDTTMTDRTPARAALVDHPHGDARRNDDHREVDAARQLADRRAGTAVPTPRRTSG